MFEIDGDGDGVTDSRFALSGDFAGQAFEVISDGTDTKITLAGAVVSQLSSAGAWVPGGSGCDDPEDLIEHPECMG